MEMITTKNILSVLEELSSLKIRRARVDVSINPSSVSEVLRDLKEKTRTREFKENPNIRFVLDFETNDIIAGIAYEVVHVDLFPYVKPNIGGKLFTKDRAVDLTCYGMVSPIDDLKEMDIGKSIDRLYSLVSDYTIEVGSICLASTLHSLVLHRDLERIKKVMSLLQRGPTDIKRVINDTDDDNKTPYSLAIGLGYQDIADYLKKFGSRE
jgi:hypothetical protein